MALAKQADIRDSRDAALSNPPRPTLFQAFWRWALQPVLGLFAAVYAIAALTAIADQHWVGGLLVLVGSVALGIWGARIRSGRGFAIGWLGGSAVLMAGVVVAVARQAIN